MASAPSASASPSAWFAAAAAAEFTPAGPRFLFGYPGVPRTSTGTHDPLLASALVIGNAAGAAVAFVGCDIIWVPRDLVHRVRRRIAQATTIPADHVMITATHSHSGPVTAAMLSNANDPLVPPPHGDDLRRLEDAIFDAVVKAHAALRPAALSYAVADGSKLGTNRRDPQGPAIPRVPVLIARDAQSNAPLAVMCVVSMHPTVLHEDFTQFSGDFPGLARQWLQTHVTGPDCPLVYHMGASGNQSPRHVVKSNTLEEAQRLGEILGRELASALQAAQPLTDAAIEVRRAQVTLPLRLFPEVAHAKGQLQHARERFEGLRRAGAPRATVRTAECDVFGAEETLSLAQAAADGRLQAAAATCMPAEIHHIQIGQLTFIGWPGEVFVEFALAVMAQHPDVHIITLAGGDLQGYLVTQPAIDEKAYEAGNALFASPASGNLFVDATLNLLRPSAPTKA
jgi:hypothetical protein